MQSQKLFLSKKISVNGLCSLVELAEHSRSAARQIHQHRVSAVVPRVRLGEVLLVGLDALVAQVLGKVCADGNAVPVRGARWSIRKKFGGRQSSWNKSDHMRTTKVGPATHFPGTSTPTR